MSYNFFHLRIQEVLTVFCIARYLPVHKQVFKFNDEPYNKSCFNTVFQFYAAITKH